MKEAFRIAGEIASQVCRTLCLQTLCCYTEDAVAFAHKAMDNNKRSRR